MKARLCNKDMCNLVDLLRELPEALKGVGVDGNMTINVGVGFILCCQFMDHMCLDHK